MKGVELRMFQEDAVGNLVDELQSAAAEVARRAERGQAVWLSAPTGSGKTLIATAAIERILRGDDRYLKTPDATFLWLSDQPQLNVQTRNKMLETSSHLTAEELLLIESDFEDESLPSGRVYFLNIQKLAKDATLVRRGDRRTWSIWQTIENTVERSPHRFFLLIDEAHRGTNEKDRKTASTIVQKFIKGSPDDGLRPIPIIAGISATPERFEQLVAGLPRVKRPVLVPADEVRESGLLKDVIDLRHPKVAEAASMTMLEAAAKEWHRFWVRWERYCLESAEAKIVRPIFVVQVEDGTAKTLTRTSLETCVDRIRAAIGSSAGQLLPSVAFAHAFDRAVPAHAGTETIRHIDPSDINDDPDVRIVFFKTSLNTGWDCPRAEVMMSFRTAIDVTAIAQLVGRMVRTPLARRNEADDALNAVALYLPQWDAKNLKVVIDKLTGGDPDTALPIRVRLADEQVELVKAVGSEGHFSALSILPTYTVPRSRRTSQVKRLAKLAFLLVHDEIDLNAQDAMTRDLVASLRLEYDKRKDTPEFRDRLTSAGAVRVLGRRVRYGVKDEGALAPIDERRTASDVDTAFEDAGRALSEGLHQAWRKMRVSTAGISHDEAKLEAVALAADPGVAVAIERRAQETTQAWLRLWREPIATLPASQRAAYHEVQGLAADVELVSVREPYPERIVVNNESSTWPRHVYVDLSNEYPAKLTSWEETVLSQELERPEVVAWLRNPPRAPWSIAVPYKKGGEWHPQYPDFLIVRVVNGKPQVDVLEPHHTNLADAAYKAVGLADFADKHAGEFGSIKFIVVEANDVVTALDLVDETQRRDVKIACDGGDPEKLKLLLEKRRGQN